MIIGNPSVFSIIVDVVDEWNYDKSFNNGLLFIGINGTLLLPKITMATLNTEVCELLENLKKPKDNAEIFKMDKQKAFKSIYKITFPSDNDLDNDYRYNITPYEFANNHCFIFMVGNDNQTRVLASKLLYFKKESIHDLQNIDVVESYISNMDLKKIIRKLTIFKKKSNSV